MMGDPFDLNAYLARKASPAPPTSGEPFDLDAHVASKRRPPVAAQESTIVTPPHDTSSATVAGLLGAMESVPFADRAVAAAGAALPEQGTTFGQRYDAKREALKQAIAQHRSQHPIAYGAGEGLGTVAQLVALPEVEGTGMLARALRSTAGQGALYGAAQGASNAEGSAGDFAKGAAIGGLTGAVAAPLVGAITRPAVGYVARKAANYLPGKVGQVAADVATATGPNRRALSTLETTLAKQGKTAAQVGAESARLVPPANVGQSRPMIEQAARELQATGKRFPEAYQAAANITDPELDAALASGPGKALWQRAQKDAAKYGRELPTKQTAAFTLPETASPDLRARFAALPGAGAEEVPIPDPEALHYMRKAAAADPALQETFDVIKAAVQRHAPDLDKAIEDYAAGARKFEVLKAGKRAPGYLSASSESTPALAVKPGDPLRAKEALTGVEGLKRAVQNMSPTEQQQWRMAAQDRIGELLKSGKQVGDNLSNEEWQTLLFGSPETYNVFEAGAQARPHEGALQSVKEDLATGWVPHSERGMLVKGGQVVSRMLRGKPHLTSDAPMTLEEVIRQMQSRRSGQHVANALAVGGANGIQGAFGQ